MLGAIPWKTTSCSIPWKTTSCSLPVPLNVPRTMLCRSFVATCILTDVAVPPRFWSWCPYCVGWLTLLHSRLIAAVFFPVVCRFLTCRKACQNIPDGGPKIWPTSMFTSVGVTCGWCSVPPSNSVIMSCTGSNLMFSGVSPHSLICSSNLKYTPASTQICWVQGDSCRQ